MNTRHRRSFIRLALSLGGAIVAAALLSVTPADAHGGRGHFRGGAVVSRRPIAHARFVVPRLIDAHRFGYYRPYYVGQYFAGPYRRPHMVYRFPVVVGGVVVHQPFVYSDGQLVVGATIPSGFFIGGRFNDGYYDRGYDRDDRGYRDRH